MQLLLLSIITMSWFIFSSQANGIGAQITVPFNKTGRLVVSINGKNGVINIPGRRVYYLDNNNNFLLRPDLSIKAAIYKIDQNAQIHRFIVGDYHNFKRIDFPEQENNRDRVGGGSIKEALLNLDAFFDPTILDIHLKDLMQLYNELDDSIALSSIKNDTSLQIKYVKKLKEFIELYQEQRKHITAAAADRDTNPRHLRIIQKFVRQIISNSKKGKKAAVDDNLQQLLDTLPQSS